MKYNFLIPELPTIITSPYKGNNYFGLIIKQGKACSDFVISFLMNNKSLTTTFNKF